MKENETCKKCYFYRFQEIEEGQPVRNMCAYTKKHVLFLNRKLAKVSKCDKFITEKHYLRNRKRTLKKFKIIGVSVLCVAIVASVYLLVLGV